MNNDILQEAEQALHEAINEGIVSREESSTWTPDDLMAWYEKQLEEPEGEEKPY